MNTPEQDLELAFDKAYWLHQPAPVREMQHMPNVGTDGSLTSSPRGPKALELTQQGYDIDVPIMVYDWDPYFFMLVRESQGMSESYLNGKKLRVSSKIEDYPPIDPPPPSAPLPDGKLVKGFAFADLYFSTDAGRLVPDGTRIQEGGVNYMKQVTQGLVGTTHLFKRV